MKNKKYLTGLVIALAVVVVSSASVFAASTDETPREFGQKLGAGSGLTDDQRAEMRAEMEERRAEMDALLEAGDYDAWYDYVSENERGGNFLEVITEDNFDEFIQAHELMEDARGLMEEAKGIFEELGIEKPGNGFGGQQGPGLGGPGHGSGNQQFQKGDRLK